MKKSRKSKSLDFTGQTVYTGIDVHLKSWKVAHFLEQRREKVYSMNADPSELVRHLKKNYPGADYVCVYEAGFCGYWVQHRLEEQGVKCIVTHAADVPSTYKEKLLKNDWRDAIKLARGLRSGDLTEVYVPTKEELMSRSLVRKRYNIAKSSRRVKNQIKMHLHFYGIELPKDKELKHWSRRFIKWLNELKDEHSDMTLELMLDELEYIRKLKLKALGKIRELSRTEVYKENVGYLLSVPGVGLLTAMLLLTELVDILRFKTLDEICCYIGLCPSTNSSGEKERIGSMSKRGNSHIRNALIESSWVAIRWDEVLGESYHEWKEKTSKGNKAIVKVARKLLNRIRFVLKNRVAYEKGHRGRPTDSSKQQERIPLAATGN